MQPTENQTMNAMNPVAAAVASLDYDRLLVAMTNACRVVNKRNSLPVLNYVTVTASRRGGVQICGTDLDRYTTTFVPGSADKDFACMLEAHKVLAVLRKAKAAKTVNLSAQGGRVVMSIGKLNVTMAPDVKVDDFEDAAFREGLKRSNCSFTLKAEDVARILQRISFAISTEETRYYLNGVYMHAHERRPKLVFVTTDGHRLARYEIDAPAGVDAMSSHGAIIPRVTIDELNRLTKRKDCPADIRVTVTDIGVSFLIGEDELLESKLVDGTFPDYNRVIPTGNDHRLRIVPSLMIEAVTQAATVLTERGRSVRLDIGDGWMRASCTDPEFGTADMRIAIENETPLEIGFNADYLLSILERIDGKAEFKFADRDSPVLVFDTGDACVTYVQMPMRV